MDKVGGGDAARWNDRWRDEEENLAAAYYSALRVRFFDSVRVYPRALVIVFCQVLVLLLM